MEIELQYRGLSTRMVSFGPVPVTWGFRTPKSFGPHELVYDRLGTRLIAIGPFEICHDRFGTRPIRFGRHDMVYGRAGARLTGIGAFTVDYRRWGGRMRTIGPFEITYDRLGTRPRRLHTLIGEYEGRALDDETAAILFFVLTVIQNRQRSGGEGGAGE